VSVRGRHVVLLFAAAVLAAAACGPSRSATELRQWTDHYAFRIQADPAPPRARERIIFKVVVTDKETRQPIENGEGQLYAGTPDGASTYDALEQGPEVGTYYAHLSFITAGTWSVGLRFRRDSTATLEKTTNWTQEVRASR
jgi:hypothetical protein